MSLKFEITTPERTVYQDEIDSVSVPTSTGEVTILSHHIPMVSQLVAGDLTIRKGSDITLMAVTGGFLEVKANSQVIILADAAERAEEIDVKRAEEARERAKQLMTSEHQDSEAFAAAVAAMERASARLRIGKRGRHRGHHSTALTDQ